MWQGPWENEVNFHCRYQKKPLKRECVHILHESQAGAKAPHEERPGILGCDTAYASAKAGKCGFYVMRQLLSEKRIGYIIKAH